MTAEPQILPSHANGARLIDPQAPAFIALPTYRPTRTIATEILFADSARHRCRLLARRQAALAYRLTPPPLNGTLRYHALPYGFQCESRTHRRSAATF